MHSIGFLLVLLCGLLHESKTRFISLNLNLSAAYSSDERPNLNADMLSSCLKETEISMAELNRFRLGLLSNDGSIIGNPGDNADATNDENENENDNDASSITDYDDGTPAMLNERNDESLQCFAHCLYDRLGLVKDGLLMERDLFARLYAVVEHDKRPIKECMNLESKNKCQASYKMHLCYSRLKTLEAERRIREILEYGGGDVNDAMIENNGETPYLESDNEGPVAEKETENNEIGSN